MGQAGVQNAVGWVQGGLAITPSPYTKAAAVALTALNYGCSFDPGDSVQANGCWERETPTFVEYFESEFRDLPGKWTGPFTEKDSAVAIDEVIEFVSFDGFTTITNPSSGVTQDFPVVTLRFKDGTTRAVTGAQGYTNGELEPIAWRLFDNGSACQKEGPPQPDSDPVEPITGFSAELNCNITATLNGFRLNSDGTASPVITYTTDQTRKRQNDPTTRNDIVQDCNWYGDLVYTGPSNCDCPTVTPLPENPDPIPAPPGPGDCPDPCPDIQPEPVGESKYLMIAPCEKDPQGNNLEWEKTIPASTGLPAISARLEAISEQISQNLAWKTPICDEQTPREGEFRTINFRSASPSPYSSSRLRKRFRYRSISGLGLGEVVDHWKDFTFESGPVVVGHVGSAWGTPQVWASSEDEGKRVIRHAAGEAGIDPDQVGRWRIGSSDSSRYGVSDTMSVDTEGGFYRITSRDGSDGRPIVAKDIDL